MRTLHLLTAALLALPIGALAQSGPTQSRDGLDTATQGKGAVNNAAPAGSVNAVTGPQSRPAYPSGSTTANPGAAFVRDKPTPSTGPIAAAPGIVSTTTVGPGGADKTGGPGVGQAATPPK